MVGAAVEFGGPLRFEGGRTMLHIDLLKRIVDGVLRVLRLAQYIVDVGQDPTRPIHAAKRNIRGSNLLVV